MPKAVASLVSSQQEILFATDFREGSRSALLYARHLARIRNCSVRAIHVLDLTDHSGSRSPSWNALRGSAERLLRDTRRELRLSGVSESATLITAGRPSAAIRGAALQFHAGLLVLGSNSGRPGSTARALLRNAPCPLAMVSSTYRDPGIDRPKHVHFVTDREEAQPRAAVEHLLPAADDSRLSVFVVCPAETAPEDRLEPSAARILPLPPRAVAALLSSHWKAAPPDLVIIHSHPGGALNSVASRSLAITIIREAPCPVIAIRE